MSKDPHPLWTPVRRILLDEWDPIGVMSPDASPGDNEYDDLLWPLMRLLETGATARDLFVFVRNKLTEDYGIDPDEADLDQIAGRVKDWFENNWAGTRA